MVQPEASSVETEQLVASSPAIAKLPLYRGNSNHFTVKISFIDSISIPLQSKDHLSIQSSIPFQAKRSDVVVISIDAVDHPSLNQIFKLQCI